MRRAHHHQPRETRKFQVIAIAALADQEPIVLDALLGTRGAEARRRRIELDLQGGRAQ